MDLTPVPPPPDAPPAGGDAPFVAVYTDPSTGRAVIALDSEAVALLLSYLDDIGPGYDLSIDPGSYGLDDAFATAVADVVSRISGPLGTLPRWTS